MIGLFFWGVELFQDAEELVGDGGPAEFGFVEVAALGGDVVSLGGLFDQLECFLDETGTVLGIGGEEGGALA